MLTLFPYDQLFGDLVLAIDDLKVDGMWPAKDPTDTQFRLLNLDALERQDWRTLSLVAHIEGPADELADLEQRGSSPTITLVAACDATNERQAARLTRSETDVARWHGTLELDRANFRGKTSLYGVLAAKVERSPFRLLGRTEDWTIYFDEPAIPPVEGTLRVRWVHFKGEDRPEVLPDDSEHEPFYIDLESTVPIVYLNSDFEGLPGLLSDERGRPAADSALRDAEYRRIATAAWTEIFNVGVAAIRKGEDEEADWPAIDWQENALRSLLPRIYPMTPTEALGRAHEDITGDGALGLQSRAQIAISKEISAGRSLRRSIDRLSSGKGSR